MGRAARLGRRGPDWQVTLLPGGSRGAISRRTQAAPSHGRFAIARAGKARGLAGVNLHVLPAGPIETNAYLLTEPARGEAILIDAPGDIWAEVGPILGKAHCRLLEVWLTHGHWDHTQGAAEIVRATQARVSAHLADQVLIETPGVMERFMGARLNLEPVRVDRWVEQGQLLAALGTEAEVRHVPGHCPGNVLFHFAAARMAFVGDALFQGGIGRTDLPGGSFDQLERSIRSQIYTLPGNTIVFPGHGPKTSVSEEMAHNPYVSGQY